MAAAGYERPAVMKCDRLLLLQQQQADYQYNSVEGYGDCPLIIITPPSPGSSREPPRYVQMKDWIECLASSQVPPMSYHFQQPFSEPGNSMYLNLDGLRWQRYLHEKLWFEGFSSANFPFKLEKWDPESNRWLMLTIDCHVIVASYLIFLGKQPDMRRFVDYVHSRQTIDFKTEKVLKTSLGVLRQEERVLDYIEVTPILVTRTERGDVEEEEGLRLTVSDNCGLFPNIRFTAPAVMAAPPTDFTCGICLNGNFNEDDDRRVDEPVFKTGCGGVHCFHRHCIEGWFSTGKSSCPLCRTTIKHFIV